MAFYELSNNQRRFFALRPVSGTWERQILSNVIAVYFDGNKIRKILDYTYGYKEYDCDINTIGGLILLPQTKKGKEQKFTIQRMLKIKGSDVQLSGSFQGGEIQVYDNRRNLFFIKSFFEEGEIKNYYDIDNWISNFIAKVPNNYFTWLEAQLSKKRFKIKAKEGDILAFKIAHYEYGFARILLNVFTERKKGYIERPEMSWVHPRSLIVAPYAYYSNDLTTNIDILIQNKTLPSLCIFDLDVYRGESPIIGNRPLSELDIQIPFPKGLETSATIRYTKTDIINFMAISSDNDDNK
ncbi:MAG: Imm26 family immunity protein [Ferruginibacter sp.]